MGLPVGEVQVAYISLYRGDTTLQGMIRNASAPTWSIYDADGVPTNQAFDYIVVQQIIGKPGTVLSMGGPAMDIYTLVSIFTQAGGFSHARALAKRIDDLTNGRNNAASLVLANGFKDIWTYQDLYQEIPGADGLTQQIVLRYVSWITG